MVAKMTARSPRITPTPSKWSLNEHIRAPTMVIPLIAFDPLMSGVCSVAGTFVITSKPMKIARTKTMMLTMNGSMGFPILDFGFERVDARVKKSAITDQTCPDVPASA